MSESPNIEELISAADNGNAGAQYNLGVCYLRGDGVEPDPALARRWIESAAAADLAAAQSALAVLHLRAVGGPYRPTEAVEMLRRASRQGFVEAICRHAEALASGLGGDEDPVAARAEFERAAEAGDPLAQCQLAYCLDEGIGGPADPVAATRWLFAAADGNSARAAAAIGERFRIGRTLPRDLQRGLAWLQRAAAVDYPGAGVAAQSLRTRLSADGTALSGSQTADVADVELIDGIHGAARAAPASRVLSETPRVLQFENLLSPEECWHLIDVARPRLRPSQVLSRVSGRMETAAGRRSGGMSIIAPLLDVVVRNIEHRLASIAGLPVENGEPLSILSYAPGDEYRPHVDFFDPGVVRQATALERGGQRLVTVLMYLSDVTGGGETVFPEAGLRISARIGSGVVFYNCRPDGSVDRSSRHAGAPVREGQKWLATKWIRERRFG